MNDSKEIPSKNKPSLSLVTDNAPDYHERPSAKGRKRNKKISLVRNPDQDGDPLGLYETAGEDRLYTRIWKKKRFLEWVAGGLFSMAFGIAGYHFGDATNKPKEIIPLYADLNADGTPDAYMKLEDKYKVPLYGLRNESGESIKYVRAEEIQKIHPRPADYYQSIEDRINE